MAPRGKFGFGYDAIFQPTGYGQSFGEMDPAAKHAMSHRADAFKQLITHVFPKKQKITQTQFSFIYSLAILPAKMPYCDFNSHVSTTHDNNEFGKALCLETYMAEILPDGH